MRTGLFCTFENPQRDYPSAYSEQLNLVHLVETLGFDEAWVAEHHFNPDAASPSSLTVLAHLAAKTTRIRLGSAAVLLPFRDPIQVAEDVATVDILSEGRFDFGVAKGGPFPTQSRVFGARPDARRRTLEALTLIRKLLAEDDVRFEGEFFKVDGVTLVPRPLQVPVPTFVATSTADTIRVAAAEGQGLMCGPPFPIETVRACVHAYRESAPSGGDPKLVLIRFYHLASSDAQAAEEARVLLAPFAERMRAATATLQPEWTPWFDIDRIVDESLIGTAEAVRDKIACLERELGPRSLILKPLSASIAKRRADLTRFAAEIRR